MNPRKIRWGILSTANICRSLNPAIQASGNGILAAVASRDTERARVFAAKWSIAKYYGTYAELIDDPDVDAIYIPLPNGLHREWTIRALEARKHVLCEKPLAPTAAACLEMQRAADANGVKLMEAFMYRFHPRTEKLIAMVRSGALGDIRAIRSAFTFKLTRPNDVRWMPDQGGGALLDVGCYCVNISRTLVGAEPMEVQASARWHTTGVDASVAGSMQFASGLVAHFDCALDLERREFCDVGGTDSAAWIDAAFVPGAGTSVIVEHRAQRERVVHEVPPDDQYCRMVEHFADCALNGGAVRYSATEAAANLRVIEALFDSARNGGRAVKLI